MTIRYHSSAERPSLELWLEDDDGTLIDFSSGYTFSVKIGTIAATLLTKTTGITGAAGSGSEPSGAPNLTVAWTAGELDITPGAYTLQVTATTSGLDRVFSIPIQIIDALT